MIVNISELEKGNGELYMVHGNVNITIWYILQVQLNNVIQSEISAKQKMEKYETIKEKLKVKPQLMDGNGYETQQSPWLHVFVLFFGIDHAQNTIVVYSVLIN